MLSWFVLGLAAGGAAAPANSALPAIQGRNLIRY